jgi:ABC-type Fe3+/spermidine/putrescine transport system ATPase subunit
MVSVKYKNIGCAYDDFVVVQGFDLEIPHGTITTLLGPSGCGKTTVLRALAGFVEPFEGNVFLGDKDITVLPPQKRNTAMIFQNYALWPHLDIFKNVEYGLKLRESEEQASLEKPWYSFLLWFTKPYYWLKGILTRGKSITYVERKAEIDKKYDYRRKKVYDVLKLVHLEDQADKLPTQLSGGQQQRIALCRAIVVEPDVLLCDEPLSNLDAKLRREIRTEIRSIIKKIGMTTVYVTHDQEEALAISDRIAVLHEGIIQQYGTPTEVFSDPQTLFVAQFIGSSSTLNGKVVGKNEAELESGERVKYSIKEDIPVGTSVNLVIRPENILLDTETDSPIEYQINTIEYLGTEVKMTGTLKDGTILLVDILEDAEKYAKMKVGDNITGYIIPKEVFVFVDEKRVY